MACYVPRWKRFSSQTYRSLYHVVMVRPWSWYITFLDFLMCQMQTMVHAPPQSPKATGRMKWPDAPPHQYVWPNQMGSGKSIYFLPLSCLPRLLGSMTYIQTQVFAKPKVNSHSQLHTTSNLGLVMTRTEFYPTKVKFVVNTSGLGLSNTKLQMWGISCLYL